VERFLKMRDKFANVNIDDKCSSEEDEDKVARSKNDPFQNQIAGMNIVQLKNNIIPKGVGRLVVVIDVNPSHGFWTARLMKVFGHEGKCTCRYNTHGWIVYIMLFLVVCGTSRGSSWLRRNEFLKMTK
jgi:hypothetical protein